MRVPSKELWPYRERTFLLLSLFLLSAGWNADLVLGSGTAILTIKGKPCVVECGERSPGL